MDTRKRVSEILADALALWGPDGEHWCTGSIRRDDKYCLIGGLAKAATGVEGYADEIGTRGVSPERVEDLIAVEQAVSDELKKTRALHGPTLEDGLWSWNDGYGQEDCPWKRAFPEVKAIVCAALKTAVAAEEAEDTAPGPSCRRDPVTGVVTCD